MSLPLYELQHKQRPHPLTPHTVARDAMSTQGYHPSKRLKMETRGDAVVAAFSTFCNELDEHHARRERIIKKSRDITDLSKKTIFALHRVRTLGKPLQGRIEQETSARLEQIAHNFASIAPDLAGINGYRYQWQISPGIQEYIEAISFKHYLKTTRLITLEEVRNSVPGITVTEADYVLGLFDLTGELMRFTITAIASGNHESANAGEAGAEEPIANRRRLGPIPSQILQDMRELRVCFEAMSVPRGHSLNKHFDGKLEVTCNSVSKVENAAAEVLVRGSELPSGWTPGLSEGEAAAIKTY